MSLWYHLEPEDIWAFFETEPTVLNDHPEFFIDRNQVPLPAALADEICASCRYLIPDTPAGCCWWCVGDLTDEQMEEYRQLIIAFELRVIADFELPILAAAPE